MSPCKFVTNSEFCCKCEQPVDIHISLSLHILYHSLIYLFSYFLQRKKEAWLWREKFYVPRNICITVQLDIISTHRIVFVALLFCSISPIELSWINNDSLYHWTKICIFANDLCETYLDRCSHYFLLWSIFDSPIHAVRISIRLICYYFF